MLYICSVFFMVLDLRLIKIGGLGQIPFFFLYTPIIFFLINLSSTHTSYKYKQQHSCETFKSSLYSKAKKNVKRFANPSNT